MSTEPDKSPNGVCSFGLFFLIFEVFAWSAPHGQNLENPKKTKTKLQSTCPQSQTRAPMGSAVLFFFLIFEVFAWFALLYIVTITSNCPLLCEIHVEPFKTLQNQNFHISPPPHPPLSIINILTIGIIVFISTIITIITTIAIITTSTSTLTITTTITTTTTTTNIITTLNNGCKPI